MSAGTLDAVRGLRRAAVVDVEELTRRGAGEEMVIAAELNRVWDALEHIAARVD